MARSSRCVTCSIALWKTPSRFFVSKEFLQGELKHYEAKNMVFHSFFPKWRDFGFFNYEKPSFLGFKVLGSVGKFLRSGYVTAALSIFSFLRHAPRGMALRWPLSNTTPNPLIGRKMS